MNTQHPITVSISRPEKSSRLWALSFLLFLFPKAIALVPHFIILWVLGIASFIAVVIGQFAVLFIGKYPQELFNFTVGVTRWSTRVNAFFMGLTDIYPPFQLGE